VLRAVLVDGQQQRDSAKGLKLLPPGTVGSPGTTSADGGVAAAAAAAAAAAVVSLWLLPPGLGIAQEPKEKRMQEKCCLGCLGCCRY